MVRSRPGTGANMGELPRSSWGQSVKRATVKYWPAEASLCLPSATAPPPKDTRPRLPRRSFARLSPGLPAPGMPPVAFASTGIIPPSLGFALASRLLEGRMCASQRTTLLDIAALTSSPPLGFTFRAPTTELTPLPLTPLRKPVPAPPHRNRLWLTSTLHERLHSCRSARPAADPISRHDHACRCASDLFAPVRTGHVNRPHELLRYTSPYDAT